MKRTLNHVAYGATILAFFLLYVVNLLLSFEGKGQQTGWFYVELISITLVLGYFAIRNTHGSILTTCSYVLGIVVTYIGILVVNDWLPSYYVQKKYGLDLAFDMFVRDPTLGFILILCVYVILYVL